MKSWEYGTMSNIHALPPAAFKNPDDCKRFVLAGHATVTLTSEKTGKWFTYRISQAKDRQTGEPQDFWFVNLLTGPDNSNDFTYMGVIGNNGFRLTQKSRLGAEAPSVKAFQFFWRHLYAGNIPADLTVRHDGTCGRCGRKLTVPSSLASGLGPECAGKIGLASHPRLL
jgi:hypothetical protein